MRLTVPTLMLSLVGSAAHADPANSPQDLCEALGASARHAKAAPEATGSEIIVLFTLKRDGTVQGKPRITYSRLIGDNVDQQAFIAASLSALASCFPLPITSVE
ncbi:hypothetical protein [Methylobacterium sp. PvR107]|uniref:hypothetical protein n=1 Tax=Methylobacterium sp. PvR107 TaxID=2806597 RepID=UPI001AE53425|nr:hypothetical protein [Methylobacterium sp. PvR107]MBP1179263.1 hypothetical protein [Methylobacterium sp. PvR107]